MSKFSGRIGFAISEETMPGYFDKTVRERKYRGVLLRNVIEKNDNETTTNRDIGLSNRISIVADAFGKDHIYEIAYVIFSYPSLGGIWNVRQAEVVDNRIILTLGGLYSGPTADVTGETGGVIGV